MEAVATPARRPGRWPLGWLYVVVLVVAGSFAAWFVACFLYHDRLKSAGYATVTCIFLIGPALLLVLALVGLLALVLALTNVFRRRWRRALAWLLLCTLSGGSCALGFVPAALMQVSGIADDEHQNE